MTPRSLGYTAAPKLTPGCTHSTESERTRKGVGYGSSAAVCAAAPPPMRAGQISQLAVAPSGTLALDPDLLDDPIPIAEDVALSGA